MRNPNSTAENTYAYSLYLFRVVLLVCLVLSSLAQVSGQRPNYQIRVVLDTAAHQLFGTIDITYTNQSSTPLDKLGIHLWPNAYSRKNTALVDQMLLYDNLEFYKAKQEDMGGLSDLSFKSESRQVKLEFDDQHIDIGWLVLDQPLAPQETIQLSSPFVLSIPLVFSRLGRSGAAYQLTQWYPHLAVFDSLGWHTMPYLDYGEFYNDFADYKVILYVPQGYTVASTGVLQSRLAGDPLSAWIFTASNVIDFAWFASPTFIHTKAMVDVGDDHEVELNLYTEPADAPLWDKALDYGQRALQFYSDWLGPYPYPQMSVVSTPLGVGGGMEYPMVAHIGAVSDTAELDILMAHEIGHTWLYGILANDERSNPWMDEGLNSFIENQYAAAYQPDYEEDFIPSAFKTPGSMRGLDELQHTSRFSHILQPPASDPEYQRGNQYFFSAYQLPAQGLEIMKSMLGIEKMKSMFRQYYTDHKFTHVTPSALQQTFEMVCNCDLNWFFDQWIHHAHEVDYRIEKFDVNKKEITIVNHGGAQIPVRISTYTDGQPLLDRWINGFESIKIIHLDDRADEVRLYNGFMGINKMRTANVRPYKLLPRIGILPKIESYDAPTISLSPVIGRNLADGFMAGVALTSGLFPQQHFKFVIAPMYGFESHALRGHATLRYTNDLQQGPFDKYLLSFSLDDFGYNLDTHYYFRDHYFKWEPTLAVRFTPSDEKKHIIQWLKYRYVHIDQFYGRGLNWEDGIYAEEKRNYGVHELAWQVKSDFALKPYEVHADMQAGQGFVRLNLRYKQHFAGKTKHMGTWIQGYGGWLPVYDQPDANVNFTINGQSSNGFYSRDYMFDQWLGGRNAESGIFAHQVFEKDANLKTLATSGIGEKWMIGAGISQAFPFRFLHFYMDAAFYPSAITEETEISYSGGAAIVLLKDVFEIYLPFLESKDIRESLTYEVRDMWFERVTFTANIKLFNPVNIIDRMQLGY